MSSLRNAVSRRPHKERSQTTTRTKYGLLEKHKDYSLRAADYNAKKQKLSILQQKTRDRHPDEFAFGMVSKDKKQGKHGRRGEEENRLGVEKVRLLKGQDAGYLRVVAGRTRREVERVREETILSKRGIGKGSGKVVFGEDGEPERKRRRVLRDTDEDTDDNLNSNQDNKNDPNTHEAIITTSTQTLTNPTKAMSKILSTKQAQKQQDKLSQLKADRKRRKRLQDLRAAKLEVLKKRQKEILAAADQLDLQRAKMAGVVGGVNRDGVRFKVRERKR
ncbi:hypothetical protein LTR64_003292 [Lithohypha guttulata]|uniref:U3 small nucleolar RNA-associated protein 11 n=1 Tax=Lithohypha guttulata TaxID=1690604 RepID=A0AAN7T1B4_9EURO|nr:hypothetical protein LTR51_000488 [Lithohypha guttulata]KAK5085674.1 hypothetical protein LTR05_004962 [Lithohypha guttulata]